MCIEVHNNGARLSRYTYRCVVLPDMCAATCRGSTSACLNAPTGAVVLPDCRKEDQSPLRGCLNAPTGAVVLPDEDWDYPGLT